MKRIFAVLLLSITLLTGCDYTTSGNAGYDTIGDFRAIDTAENLYYAIDTKIVYYVMRSGVGYQGYGYMSPYISENGHFCKYDDGQIKEVEE